MNRRQIVFFLIMIISTECGIKQNRHSRVENARVEKDAYLNRLFQNKNLNYPPQDLFFRSFKASKTLEVWARNEPNENYRLVKIYKICTYSGGPGPKQKEGDGQTPEGFYYIDRYNYRSQFHLSLGLNYPNQSDLIRGDQDSPGSDIFIHGGCVSIGCLAMTDDRMKEIFWLAWQAHKGGQKKIQVHVFPFKMRIKSKYAKHKRNQKLTDFWKNLKPGYDYFEKHRILPEFEVNDSGAYVFK